MSQVPPVFELGPMQAKSLSAKVMSLDVKLIQDVLDLKSALRAAKSEVKDEM